MKQTNQLQSVGLRWSGIIAVMLLFGMAFACGDGGGTSRDARMSNSNLAQGIVGTWKHELKTPNMTIEETTTFTADGEVNTVASAGTPVTIKGTYKVIDNQSIDLSYEYPSGKAEAFSKGRFKVTIKGDTMTMSSADPPDVTKVYKRL